MRELILIFSVFAGGYFSRVLTEILNKKPLDGLRN